MNRGNLVKAVETIKDIMAEQAGYLVELDARFGDGDLGISMKQGFQAVYHYLIQTEETDLGMLLRNCSLQLNEVAPSTLGTILSFGFLGMAKQLKGKSEADMVMLADAMEAGTELIMEKAKSKPGDKTILDSLVPGVRTAVRYAHEGAAKAFSEAYKEAEAGMENTKTMQGKHGRIAYYAEQTIGETDGGAVVGMLIFQGLAKYSNSITTLKGE